MTTGNEIIFGDADPGDDDDYDRSIDDSELDATFDPESFETEETQETQEPPAVQEGSGKEVTTANIDDVKEIDYEKVIQDEVKRLEKEKKDAFRQEIAETKREQRRQQQDDARARSREAKADKKAATERRADIRSRAVENRIQTYSLASALGFKGYVAASIVDNFLIRPEEKKNIAAEKQYLRDYDQYQQQQEDISIQIKRDQEDELLSRKPDTTVLPEELDNYFKENSIAPDQEAMDKFFASRKQTAPANPNVPIPSNEFVGPNLPVEGPVQPASSSTSNVGALPPQPPNGPTLPPSNNGGGGLGGNKPEIPEAATTALAALGPAGIAVAATIEAAKMVASAFDDVADSADKLLGSSFGKDPIEAGKNYANTAIDLQTFGAGPVVGPIVASLEKGFVKLGSTLATGTLAYAEEDLQFSPEALAVSIEGEMQRLMQAIALGQENDAQKAETQRLSNELQLAWNEFRSEVFQNLGPYIVYALKTIISLIQQVVGIIDTIRWTVYYAVTNIPVFGMGIKAILDRIAKNTDPEKAAKDAIDDGILEKLRQFNDPNNFKDLPKGAFRNK